MKPIENSSNGAKASTSIRIHLWAVDAKRTALKRVKDTVSKFLSETLKKFKAGEVKLSQVV